MHRQDCDHAGGLNRAGNRDSAVFLHLSDVFVAEFPGIRNVVRGISIRSGNLARIIVPGGLEFFAASDLEGEVVAMLHPGDVIVSHEPFAFSARSCLPGTVLEIILFGSAVLVILDVLFPIMALLHP